MMLSAITFHDFLPFSLLVEKKFDDHFSESLYTLCDVIKMYFHHHHLVNTATSDKSHLRCIALNAVVICRWLDDFNDNFKRRFGFASANGKIYVQPFSSLVTEYKKTMAKNNIYLQD